MRALIAFWLLAASPALADCDGFRWSVAGEKVWFASAPEPLEAGGAAQAARAYEVALEPAAQAQFAVAPKQAPGVGELGGIVRIDIPRPGTFQVTTTREVWVDVVQNGALQRVRSVSRQRDCPSFVKSVRFALKTGPAVIQFSRAKAAALGFAVAPGG